MLRRLLLTASIASICVIQTASAQAMGGTLRKPGIAIPSADKEGKLDSTAAAMNKVFQSHEKQFAGGHFINAHSVMHFTGGTKTINILLQELSQIDGAVVHVRFSKGSGAFTSPFTDEDRRPNNCDCSIDHNGWADPHVVTITIFLEGDVTLEDLDLPAIRGSGKSEKIETRLVPRMAWQ